MASIKLINHSSILFEEDGNFILTDPWYEKPAFGSWLPVPPTSVHPSYLVSLSQAAKSFAILISHGHDDHFDDEFLSLFPKSTTVIIPKYRSKGVLKRTEKVGFTNIMEAPTQGVMWNNFEAKSFINSDISGDDAIMTIAGKDHYIVHANDNWQPIDEEDRKIIERDFSRYKPENTLYMSQCNLADGWPNIYRDYNETEKRKIHANRVDNIIFNGLKNASNFGFPKFLNYAGYAAAFIKGKEQLRDITSYESNEKVRSIASTSGFDVDVVDMVPGDSYNFKTVISQFPGVRLDQETIKNSSYAFYEAYNRISRCDSYTAEETMSTTEKKETLQKFLEGFKEFVSVRKEYGFNTDIVDFSVGFKCTDVECEVDMGESTKKCIFHLEPKTMTDLLLGRINWENLYVGYSSELETIPRNSNARPVVRWLAMYGYKYQREASFVR